MTPARSIDFAAARRVDAAGRFRDGRGSRDRVPGVGPLPRHPATVPVALGHFTAGFAGAVCLGGLVLILITAADEAGII